MNCTLRILSLSVLTLITGCNKSKDSYMKRDVAAIPNSPRLPLGAAYQTVSGSFLKQSCLGASGEKDSLRVLPFPEGSLMAGFGESRAVIEDKFSLGVSVAGGLPGISVEGGVEVALAMAETDLKTSSYVSYSYRAGSVLLTDPAITPEGRGIQQKIKNSAQPAFELFRECGDEWVHRVDLGARIHVGVEYTFASKELKDKAKASLKIKGPLGVTLFKFEEGTESTLLDKSLGTIQIILEQEGGDMGAFAELRREMPKNCLLKVDNNGDVVKARFAACTDFYQNQVLPYIRDANRRGSFAQQMKNLGGAHFKYQEGNPYLEPGLNVLRYYTRRYDQSAFPELQSTWQSPKELEQFARDILAPFDQDVFRLQSWQRSLAQISGHPEIIKPSGLDQEKLMEARREIGLALDEGTIGLGRCRELLKSRLSSSENLDGIESDKQTCRSDRQSFIHAYDKMLGHLPAAYRPSLEPHL